MYTGLGSIGGFVHAFLRKKKWSLDLDSRRPMHRVHRLWVGLPCCFRTEEEPLQGFRV